MPTVLVSYGFLLSFLKYIMKKSNVNFFTFNKIGFAKLSKVLKIKSKKFGKYYRFEIKSKLEYRKLALEIYPNIPIGGKAGNLISVYTLNTHLQLHFCSGFVVSEMLNEVTFMAITGDKICGLIVEREGGCSLYANVDKEILSGDFTTLGPEVMLSGIALSLTENLLTSKRSKT
jgi:hypothetical protein